MPTLYDAVRLHIDASHTVRGLLAPVFTDEEIAEALRAVARDNAADVALLEACVPNKTGKGHHDDQTGFPCRTDGGGVEAPWQSGKSARKEDRKKLIAKRAERGKGAGPGLDPVEGNTPEQTKAVRKGIFGALKKAAGAVGKGFFKFGAAVHHALEIPHHAAHAMVKKVAEERGFSPEHVKEVAQTIATHDLILGWTIKIPIAHGMIDAAEIMPEGDHYSGLALAKVGYYFPVAALGYLAYSAARNPLAMVRAAKRMLTEKTAHAHESRLWESEYADLDKEELTAHLLAAFDDADDPDWYHALLSVGLDKTHDLASAMELADEALERQPTSGEEITEGEHDSSDCECGGCPDCDERRVMEADGAPPSVAAPAQNAGAATKPGAGAPPKPGYTGEIKDKLGRRMCFAQGKRIACGGNEPEASAKDVHASAKGEHGAAKKLHGAASKLVTHHERRVTGKTGTAVKLDKANKAVELATAKAKQLRAAVATAHATKKKGATKAQQTAAEKAAGKVGEAQAKVKAAAQAHEDAQALYAAAQASHGATSERLEKAAQMLDAAASAVQGEKEAAAKAKVDAKKKPAAKKAPVKRQKVEKIDVATLSDEEVDQKYKEIEDQIYGAGAAQTRKRSLAVRQRIHKEYSELRDEQHKRKLEKRAKLTAERRKVLDSAIKAGPVQLHGMTDREEMNAIKVGSLSLIYAPGASDAVINDAAMLKRRAAELPRKLMDAQKQVIFTTQRNGHDEHWEKTYGIKGFMSAATGGDGKVVVYNGGSIGYGTLAHEAGHNFANQLWGSAEPPGDSDYGRAQNEEDPVSKYGGSSPAEDFAEACRMYSDKEKGGVWSRDGEDVVPHDLLKQKFPRKFKAIEELLR